MSSSGYQHRPYRIDPNSQFYSQFFEHLSKIMFGGDEKRPEYQSSFFKFVEDQGLEMKSQETDEDLKKISVSGGCYGANLLPDYYLRRERARDAGCFTKYYKFASGDKICIHPYGPPISCLSDYCLGSAWVGVHGMQSMCLVTRRELDMTRLHPFYQKDCMKRQNMEMFARVAISELECLPHKEVAFYDVAFRQMCTGTVKKPFGVVSLGQGVPEEICDEDSKQHTIDYLDTVVSSDLVHTHYGIIRVAIKAYQLLMWRHKDLRADDIWVTIMEDFEPNSYEDLPVDKIGEQLDIVNGLASEKDPEKPMIIKYCPSKQD